MLKIGNSFQDAAGNGPGVLGSGTAVARDGNYVLVLTCQHLFGDGQGQLVATTPAGQSFEAQFLGVDQTGADLAAVAIKDTQNVVPVAEIADPGTTPAGTPVYAVGYPGGDRQEIRSGTYSSPRMGITYTADLSPEQGMSGGGMFRAADGKLIGVTITKDQQSWLKTTGGFVGPARVHAFLGDQICLRWFPRLRDRFKHGKQTPPGGSANPPAGPAAGGAVPTTPTGPPNPSGAGALPDPLLQVHSKLDQLLAGGKSQGDLLGKVVGAIEAQKQAHGADLAGVKIDVLGKLEELKSGQGKVLPAVEKLGDVVATLAANPVTPGLLSLLGPPGIAAGAALSSFGGIWLVLRKAKSAAGVAGASAPATPSGGLDLAAILAEIRKLGSVVTGATGGSSANAGDGGLAAGGLPPLTESNFVQVAKPNGELTAHLRALEVAGKDPQLLPTVKQIQSLAKQIYSGMTAQEKQTHA